MLERMLGVDALAEVAGPLKDFAEKLGGREGPEWFAAFKRFLRKEDPWGDRPELAASTFKRDMRKEGCTLLEDVEGPGDISIGNLELVPFLEGGERSINGEELVRRARGKLRANYGQRHAEYLLDHQTEIPEL